MLDWKNISPGMLDKPEVLAAVTERPRFLPWEFETPCMGVCRIFFLVKFATSLLAWLAGG